jgi:hypothetical protein
MLSWKQGENQIGRDIIWQDLANVTLANKDQIDNVQSNQCRKTLHYQSPQVNDRKQGLDTLSQAF